MRVTWAGGGDGEVEAAEGVHVTVLSSRVFPPGAPARGTAEGTPPREFTLKVTGSKREGERFRVRGRLVGATVDVLAAFRQRPPGDGIGPGVTNTIRGVLLDIDGTLIDSNDAHAEAWVEALAESGIQTTFEQVRRLIGKGGDKLLPEVSGISEETPEGQTLSQRRSRLFQARYLPRLKAFPGTRELLQRMKAGGLKLVVATSAKDEELAGLLAVGGIKDLVDARTTSDDAERSKPDPDIVGAAVRRSGLPPDALLMLGDTPYDVEAATRAGVAAVAFRCGGFSDRDLRGAVALYDGPADLLAGFDVSLFARR